MASKTSHQRNFSKPPPPPNLSKEHVVIWTGWHCKGDREVSREAAAKGIDVNLVVLFLSLRKKVTAEEAESFFKEEVLLWVRELLDRKQIFRASHVLKNIGLEPNKELLDVFRTTTQTDLREYIGNHLKKSSELSDEVQQSWHFLDLILDNNVLVSKYKLGKDSLECLDGQSRQWKEEIAAKLFLRTRDALLLPYLSAERLWRQLLIYNDTKLLLIWINIQYNNVSGGYKIPECFLKVFQSFPITSEMVNEVASADVAANTRQIVLNEFSKFGIFNSTDANALVTILNRLDQSDSIENVYDILQGKHSNLTPNKFLALLVEYCLEHELYHVMNVCIKDFDLASIKAVTSITSPYLDVISSFRQLTSACSEAVLYDNIVTVSKFLNEDLVDYFKSNPIVLLALMFFTKDADFLNILTRKSFVVGGVELFQAVSKLLDDFNVVKAVYNKLTKPKTCSLTYYDLLERHMKVQAKKLFSFQFGESAMPHFGAPDLVKEYGYSKQINYLTYVRESRPSKACKLFFIEQLQCCGEADSKLVQKKIYKLAVRNFYCVETTTSCVAFLEMIGVDAQALKVAITSANILYSFNCLYESVVDLFLKVENDPYPVLRLLENKIVESIDFESFSNPDVFIEALKFHDIAVRFALCYDLKLPDLFLKQCASHGMWLPLLVLAQMWNYPIEQVKTALQPLKNPNLLEHISHSVQHDIQVDDQSVLMRERDSRSSFLSRIGVQKSVDTLQSDLGVSSLASQVSGGSNASSMGSDLLEIDVSNTKTTLAQTLIRCHNSTDPPRALLQACQLYRNPLLAVLATSYEPDSIVTNWLTWLAVSSEICHTFTNFETVAVSGDSVAELLEKCIRNRFSKVLLESLAIFLPTNPLFHFADFLHTCVNLDFAIPLLKSKLDLFKESLGKCRRYSIVSKNDLELTYLKNKIWIETTCLRLLSSAIEFNFSSLHEQIQFVQCLCGMDIAQYINCPDMQSLLLVLTTLCESGGGVRFDINLYLDVYNSERAVTGCIDKLLEQELFETAKKIARIGEVALDKIVLMECRHRYRNNDHADKSFWEKSGAQFKTHRISPGSVVEFYLEYVDKADNALEKHQLLKLAHEWAKDYDLPTKYDIERQKWLAYVRLDKSKRCDNMVFEAQPVHLTYKEMMEMTAAIPKCEEELTHEVTGVLEWLAKEALGQGNFWQAFRLEKMFGCRLQDMEILKLSHSLAEGVLLPYQLSSEQRLLLSSCGHYRRLSHRRTFLSNRLSSLSTASLSPENVSCLPTTAEPVDGTPVQDTLTLLYILTEKVTVGVEIAHRIFMMYRISLNIEIPYHVIVSNSDHVKMLKDALEDDCMHKLDVVHDFIRVYNWSKDEITDFICEEVVNAVSKYVRSKSDDFLMWNLRMDQEFHLVLQLLQDNCSLLGNKIYSYANATYKVQQSADLDFKISELALVIELLIIAHDCFTADCNMEGISLILKTCQSIVSHLLVLHSWKLIVRLLTGVGRYTEMSYVFHILKENDHFEFLLRKGSRKDNALKAALLDYLKKYCPDNKDLYKIVALHFALFSEVALLWEREALAVIKNLIAISKLEMQNNRLNADTQPYVLFTNTDGTRLCLNKAIENYTHATEFHLQGEKLAKAMKAAKQAELIALQMSLLKGLSSTGTAVCLLNLSQAQILALISKELSFDQSLILVQAYDYTPDWASVLYEQCILRNNTAYLHAFLKHHSMTDSLIQDISRKFLAANLNAPGEIASMKQVLNAVSSVHTKYRIASEMGFMDLVEDLIVGGQLAYLKDTVWKKGYKG
ncbi:hypothetical protein NQ315_007287 [Exocentrus adspersus]|uniref:Spatacsin C-terminal domain-containing protein n=1 Tax=Exocentrus adspersus TaxID=1586481 RepID=A0AAV8WCS6_9CUCU|nr:hypothetical protein NQ315_007287 [Exocentrus adspersus]